MAQNVEHNWNLIICNVIISLALVQLHLVEKAVQIRADAVTKNKEVSHGSNIIFPKW